VFGALAYLFRTQLRNRLRGQLTRLKKPRYALALLLGIVYIGLLTIRPRGVSARTDGIPGMTGVADSLLLVTSFALALLVAKWWVFGVATITLAFSPAELQFLFPAPIRRRTLVLYRLASLQLSLLISAIFIALLFRRGSPTLPAALRVVSLWILFSTTTMHQMGVTLVRTAALQRGHGLRRSAPAIAIVAIAITTMAVVVVRGFPPVRTVSELFQALPTLGPVLRGPVPAAILAPFRWLIAPAYAHDAAQWVRMIGPAAAILILHYVWVLRADATFEEAAVDASARRAARLAARSARLTTTAPTTATRPWVRLAPTGHPAAAIIWKNFVSLTRGFRPTLAARIAVILIVIVIVMRSTGGFTGDSGLSRASGPAVLGAVFAIIAAFYLTFFGPLLVRNDLRQDLTQLAILRTYPLRGRTVVTAEIASSAGVVTVIQIGLLVVAFLLTVRTPSDMVDLTVRTRILALVASCLAIPAVNATSFLIQNGIALLFPGWVRLGAPIAAAGGGGGGIELMGQRLLAAAASFLALVAALVIPVGAGLAVGWLVGVATITRAAAALGVGFALLAAELWLGVEWLGHVYDRVEPGDVAQPQ
jgi:ABC-2 type transport system permease protein